MRHLKFWLKVISLLLLWGFLLPRFVHAQPGTPDPAFGGGDGWTTTSFFQNGYGGASAVAVQSNGRILIAGGGRNTGEKNKIILGRYMPNGTLDNTFGNGTGKSIIALANLNISLSTIVILLDGKILLGGYVQQYINNEYFYHSAMLRLTTSGLPDPTFGGGDGISILPISSDGDFAYGLALQPDGKVLAVGTARVGDYDQSFIARFLTGLTVGVHIPDAFSGKISLYPNPVREQATLGYELQTTENIALNLYDLQGRFIQNILPRTEKPAGKHKETLLFTKDIPSGNYLLVIESKSGITAIEAIF